MTWTFTHSWKPTWAKSSLLFSKAWLIFFPLTYLILIRLHISGFWLWLKAEIPNTTREDWVFFTFFPWPFQKLEVLKRVRVFPTIQFSVPWPKIGIWSSFLWKMRLRNPCTARTLHPLRPAQPPWRWQVTLRCSGAALCRQPLGALSALICPAFSDTRPCSASSTALLLSLIAAQSMGRLFRSAAQMLRLRWSLRQRVVLENRQNSFISVTKFLLTGEEAKLDQAGGCQGAWPSHRGMHYKPGFAGSSACK